MPAIVRVVHPAPTAAVVALSLTLAVILRGQADLPALDAAALLVTLSVLGSQVATGSLNDWADRHRDRLVQPDKPIPSGRLSPSGALALAVGGLALQVATSALLGPVPLVLGLCALASAVAYDLWLSRTPWSVVPYLVSFGLLPLWIASGVGVPLERVAAAPLIVGPFAAAAHLANTVRDFDGDARLGSRNLAQVIGRDRALLLGWAIALGVGIAVGIGLAASGRLSMAPLVLGVVGLLAVGQGVSSAQRLWAGMLLAAVCWTAAWALATG